MNIHTIKRINSLVDFRGDYNSCMIWKGQVIKKEPVVDVGPDLLDPRRVFWEFIKGSSLEGLVLEAQCKDPLCVNVEHHTAVPSRVEDTLVSPTSLKTIPRKRQLYEWEVREIKQRLAKKEKCIHRDYGVSRATISNIKRGDTWAHVTI